jgi:hypothetical protein
MTTSLLIAVLYAILEIKMTISIPTTFNTTRFKYDKVLLSFVRYSTLVEPDGLKKQMP